MLFNTSLTSTITFNEWALNIISRTFFMLTCFLSSPDIVHTWPRLLDRTLQCHEVIHSSLSCLCLPQVSLLALVLFFHCLPSSPRLVLSIACCGSESMFFWLISPHSSTSSLPKISSPTFIYSLKHHIPSIFLSPHSIFLSTPLLPTLHLVNIFILVISTLPWCFSLTFYPDVSPASATSILSMNFFSLRFSP